MPCTLASENTSSWAAPPLESLQMRLQARSLAWGRRLLVCPNLTQDTWRRSALPGAVELTCLCMACDDVREEGLYVMLLNANSCIHTSFGYAALLHRMIFRPERNLRLRVKAQQIINIIGDLSWRNFRRARLHGRDDAYRPCVGLEVAAPRRS